MEKSTKILAIMTASAALTLALGISTNAQSQQANERSIKEKAPMGPGPKGHEIHSIVIKGNNTSADIIKTENSASCDHMKMDTMSSQHKDQMMCDQKKHETTSLPACDARASHIKIELKEVVISSAASNQEKTSTQMKSGAMSSQHKGSTAIVGPRDNSAISTQQKIDTSGGQNCFDVSNQHKEQTGIIGPLDSPAIANQHKH